VWFTEGEEVAVQEEEIKGAGLFSFQLATTSSQAKSERSR